VPSPTRVVAIRHGETPWNVDGRIQGHHDIPLNDTGRWQALRTARSLLDEGISVIVASDLQRAADTARALGEALGLPVVFDAGLRERCFGEFETLTFAEVERRWPAQARRWRLRDVDFAPAGGESLRGFYSRTVGAVDRWARAHAGATIAIVAHGGVMDCLYRAANRVALDVPRAWPLGNASVNRLLFTGEAFSLIGWSDTRHLDDASRDDATFGSSDSPN
jgi:probable phosphoglycerate mutase